MAEDYLMTITAGAKVFAYHIWSDISVQSAMEVSNKPATGGFTADTDVIRRLPSTLSAKIVCLDGGDVDGVRVNIPLPEEVVANSIGQTISKEEQLQNLRSLLGQTVTVDARGTGPSGFTGVVKDVTVSDGGQFDNVFEVSLSITELLGGGSGGGSLTFGDITVPVPFDPNDAISGAGDCLRYAGTQTQWGPNDRLGRNLDTVWDSGGFAVDYAVSEVTGVPLRPGFVGAVVDEAVDTLFVEPYEELKALGRFFGLGKSSKAKQQRNKLKIASTNFVEAVGFAEQVEVWEDCDGRVAVTGPGKSASITSEGVARR